jgi:DNA-binding PadR family transcriptional regulator
MLEDRFLEEVDNVESYTSGILILLFNFQIYPLLSSLERYGLWVSRAGKV